MQTVFLDLETTGLNYRVDEILQIGILEDSGTVLLDTLVKPIQKNQWCQAQRINGISPEMVVNAPTLEQLRLQIIQCVSDCKVVIYNAGFDTKFIPKELEQAESIHCCMIAFAKEYGEWDDYRQSYTWQKLTTAARYVGYQWEGKAHSAISDCKATKAVWDYLQCIA